MTPFDKRSGARDAIAQRVIEDGCCADEEAAAIIASSALNAMLSAPDSVRQELAALLNPYPWHPVDPPEKTWLRTRRDGEDSENVCMWRDDGCYGREWIERDGNRTTITHHSFAEPTEWANLPAPPKEDKA